MTIFDERANILGKLEKLTNELNVVKANVKPSAKDTESREYLTGTEEQVMDFKRKLQAIKNEIAQIKEAIKDDVEEFKTLSTIFLKDGSPIERKDLSYKVVFKILQDYETKEDFDAKQRELSPAHARGRAFDDFVGYMQNEFFKIYPVSTHSDFDIIQDKYEEFFERVDAEKFLGSAIKNFLQKTLPKFFDDPDDKKARRDELPDSIKNLYSNKDWWKKLDSTEDEPEKELTDEEFKTQTIERIKKDSKLYEHIKKMLGDDSVKEIPGELLREEDGEFDQQKVKNLLKKLDEIKEALPTNVNKGLLEDYVKTYKLISNMVGHDLGEKTSPPKEEMVNRSQLNAHLKKHFKYSLFKSISELTPTNYKIFMYIYIYAKDDPDLLAYLKKPGTLPENSLLKMKKKHQRIFVATGEKTAERFGPLLKMKSFITQMMQKINRTVDFTVKEGLTNNSGFMAGIIFPNTEKDTEPKQEQIEQTLKPIIERMLKEQ